MPSDNESLYSKLKSKDVLDEFCELMFSHERGYEELLEELEKWGISSSLGALSRFKRSQIGPWSMERAKREQRDFLEAHGADLDEVTRQMVAVNIFNAAANPNTPTKVVLKMRDQEIKMAMLKHDAQRLEQAEKKLAQQDQLIDMQRRKIEVLEAQRREAEKALEAATAKEGGISEDTIKAVRLALGMNTEA